MLSVLAKCVGVLPPGGGSPRAHKATALEANSRVRDAERNSKNLVAGLGGGSGMDAMRSVLRGHACRPARPSISHLQLRGKVVQ